MAKPWIRWFAIAIAVFAALALPWPLSWPWWRPPEQWDTWIIVAIAVDATLVLPAAICWLWWRLPRRQVARLSIQTPDPKVSVAGAEDDFRKTVGQALGGAAVLIGAGAAGGYLRATLGRWVMSLTDLGGCMGSFLRAIPP